jgi:glycosyltransferase involved in cell wall biosynthesis
MISCAPATLRKRRSVAIAVTRSEGRSREQITTLADSTPRGYAGDPGAEADISTLAAPMPHVLIVRGHLVNPWELGPWSALPERFEVSYLLTGSNQFGLPSPPLKAVPARALRDVFPKGQLGSLASAVVGDRYFSTGEAFERADIVHGEELSFWFAAQAAQNRRRHRFHLVQTVWETLPLLETYRNKKARAYRRDVLDQTDLFLPATERAAEALQFEGVEPERIRVCPPGVDVERFRTAAPAGAQMGHLIVSPGRLVWEKGHQDVVRALAALRRGIGVAPSEAARSTRLLIVGSGHEAERLRAYASELGIADAVEFRSLPYEEMPSVFARASALVLASLPWSGASYRPFAIPRAFWEEQFGMVLAEAMAANLDIIASTSGAIPEVVEGTPARLVTPGDWLGIARALAEGPLSRPPGERVIYPPEVVERFSIRAAAGRLADAYDALPGGER